MSGRVRKHVGKLAVLLTLLCAPVSAAQPTWTNPLPPTNEVVIAGWHSPVTIALTADVPGQPSLAQLMHRSNSALLGMQLAIALWIFILGACFGSFLNVVIYRLPAGMSLGRPKSRCPGCETPLSARDNVPVLGWLMLRGKCRYCDMPIAVRYPLIELTCGLVLLALMFGELLTGAANLPVRHPDHFSLHSGFWLAWFAKWDLSGIYAYHSCLIIVSLATLMIGYDGHRPQRRLMLFGLLVGLVAGTMWLELRPVAALPWPDLFYQYRLGFTWGDLSAGGDSYWTGVTLVGLLDGLTGMLTAYCVGRGLQFAVGHRDAPATASVGMAICAMLTLSGAYLGWQGAVMLAIVCLPVVAMGRICGLMFPAAIRLLAPAMFVLLPGFVLGWAYLDQISWMIGIDGFAGSGLVWWQDWLIALGVLAVACGAVGLLPAVRSEDVAAVNPSVVHESPAERNAVSIPPGGVAPPTTPLPPDTAGQTQADIPGGRESDLPDGDERLPSGESP